METIRKSDHKNYLPSYLFSTEEIIEKYILSNQKNIFEKFAEKIARDSKKDGERGRKFLENQWIKASSTCKRIALLSTKQEWEADTQLVEEIINMDYQSVADFFEKLAKYYEQNNPINQELITVAELFKSMWKVSEKHTNIINRELLNTLNKEF